MLSFLPLSSLLGYLGLDGVHEGDSSFPLYLKDFMLGAGSPRPSILGKIPFFFYSQSPLDLPDDSLPDVFNTADTICCIY